MTRSSTTAISRCLWLIRSGRSLQLFTLRSSSNICIQISDAIQRLHTDTVQFMHHGTHGQHCPKIMKPPQSLPLQMVECLLRAQPDSVANHVTDRSIRNRLAKLGVNVPPFAVVSLSMATWFHTTWTEGLVSRIYMYRSVPLHPLTYINYHENNSMKVVRSFERWAIIEKHLLLCPLPRTPLLLLSLAKSWKCPFGVRLAFSVDQCISCLFFFITVLYDFHNK